jgi:hypothetical protein
MSYEPSSATSNGCANEKHPPPLQSGWLDEIRWIYPHKTCEDIQAEFLSQWFI